MHKFIKSQNDFLLKKNQDRSLIENDVSGKFINIDGRRLVSFSSNDYLGFANNPLVTKQVIDTMQRYGTGAGSSRLIAGNHPLYSILEMKLAKIKDTESALVLGSGYLTNIGVISALAGKGDLVIADKLVHSSIIDGIKLCGAKLYRFKHNDADSCARLIKQLRSRSNKCFIITETIFSMDGDVAPTDLLYDIAEKSDSILITDDAHGLFNSQHKAHIKIGTLSKAVGSYGGYVCAKTNIINYLVNKCRSLIYSTALPHMNIAASITALDIIQKDKSLAGKALNNARIFSELLALPKAQSQIVPLITGEANKALQLSEKLQDAGFYTKAIRAPTVPEKMARVRFTFSSLHDNEDIENLAACIKGMI